MATGTSSRPSFSRRRKWGIVFNVVLTLIAVLAVMVMINYLCGRYFNRRFHVSSKQKLELSPRTLAVLQSLTNQVQVILYYDRDNYLYSTLLDLLKEYKAHNQKMISISLVDYNRADAGKAQEVSTKYNLGSATNLVIFAAEGRTPQIIPEQVLMEKKLEQTESDEPGKVAYRRKPIAFRGEVNFTWALLAVSNPKPLKAYYVWGDNEHDVQEATAVSYTLFISLLRQNYIDVSILPLAGTNGVPPDCNLLIIAGPTTPMLQSELDQIDRYLNEGGRMLALFNFTTTNVDLGLEKVLAQWGVKVGTNVIVDPLLTSPEAPGVDLQAIFFSSHPAVNPLTGRKIQFIMPRMISRIEPPAPAADGRTAEEIIFTSAAAHQLNVTSQQTTNLPLAVAVQATAPKERGSTRILVVGDSFFLVNKRIGSAANRDFANFAINWLVERDFMLKGVGPKPVKEYRLLVTEGQMRAAQWLLLAAMPGGVLLFGGLVWLRRRK